MKTPAERQLDLAEAARLDKRLALAVEFYQKALTNPKGMLFGKKRRGAYGMAARCAARLGDWEGVEATARDGLGEFPELPNLLQALGEALIHLGRLEEAEAALGRALEVNPEQDGARALLAMMQGGAAEKRKSQPVRSFPNRTSTFEKPMAVIGRYLLRDRPKAPFIRPDTVFLTVGSCFAQNLARRLRTADFKTYSEEIGEEVNSTYANRYLLDWVENGATDAPTQAMDRAYGPASRARLRHAFGASQVVVMTLGVAACFFDETGAFVFTPQDARTTADALAGHLMRTTTVAENVENIERIIQSVRRLSGPEVKIVLTVSPVPMAGTTEFDSAVTADCISKSTLRLACHEVVTAHAQDGVLYWPSFEIVRWLGPHFGPELPRVYGAEDRNARHVSEWIVDLIVRQFLHFHAETPA